MSIEASKKEEAHSEARYVSLRESKSRELKASEDQMGMKTGQLSRAREARERSEEALDDTQEALETDEKFLAKLKSQCTTIDAEFGARKEARLLEVAAVVDNIGALAGDEAGD